MRYTNKWSSALNMVDTFFMFMLDAAVQKAWLPYKKLSNYYDKPLDLLGFRQEIVNIYRLRYLTHRDYIITPKDGLTRNVYLLRLVLIE